MFKNLFAAVVASLTMTGGAQAATYNIDWTGGGGYTMSGLFSFDDSHLGTGVIGLADITDLSIDVLLNGVSQGTRSILADGLGSFAASFNLNFDTVAEQFVVGGFSGGASGQDWFTTTGGGSCDTVGFSSGSGAQAVCVGGSIAASSFIDISQPTLVATRIDDPSVIPLPASAVLLLAGLGGLAVFRRRKV